MEARIRTLVVDDERLTRERISDLLAAREDVAVIGECGDGASAVAMILEQRPELLLLDIQMPELGGFDVLRAISDEYLPAVIFITAYDEFALRAFEVHALDYLMKPLEPARFEVALDRAVRIVRGDSRPALEGLVGDLAAQRPLVERIVARLGRQVVLVPPADVEWFEAAGNYLRLHAGCEVYLTRSTLSAVMAQLDPTRFVRIHRSTIVNAAQVKGLRSRGHGEYDVELRDGTVLRSSRSFLSGLQELLHP